MTGHPELSMQRRSQLKQSPVARWERMVEIRRVEDRVMELLSEGVVHGTTHTCQGQEAVAVGVAAVTEPTDHVVCTYRGHGMALAAGVPVAGVIGEIMGKVTGTAGGVGGSMHLSDPTVGLLPTMAIVGAGIPIAAGAALSAKLLDTRGVAISIFGDGATNIGAFHEGINLAAIWNLPAVFVCENNLYGEYSPIHTTTAVGDIAERAASYGIEGQMVDGQDVDAVMAAVGNAVMAARGGAGPQLLEMKTYRFSGHSRADPGAYRPPGELEEWQRRDPIGLAAARLLEAGASQAELDAIRLSVDNSVEAVIEATVAARSPGVEAMFRHVWVDEDG